MEITWRVINRGGGECGELFQLWEMWLSPHSEKPVGSEVGRQDPHPKLLYPAKLPFRMEGQIKCFPD